MAEAGRRARRTRAQWAELVEAFERSGESRQAFCAAHGVAVGSLDYWRRKLGSAASEATTPQFIDLGSITSTGGWNVELDFGAGLVLRLQRA